MACLRPAQFSELQRIDCEVDWVLRAFVHFPGRHTPWLTQLQELHRELAPHAERVRQV